MEKTMEPTILSSGISWGYIGMLPQIMENQTDNDMETECMQD